jgi:hypothetical protein
MAGQPQNMNIDQPLEDATVPEYRVRQQDAKKYQGRKSKTPSP